MFAENRFSLSNIIPKGDLLTGDLIYTLINHIRSAICNS